MSASRRTHKLPAGPDARLADELWNPERVGDVEVMRRRPGRVHASVAGHLLGELNYHFGRRTRGTGVPGVGSSSSSPSFISGGT